MKILVVDDDKDIIISIQDVLTDFQVIAANSIKTAKNILNKEPNINIAFIDIMLGEDNGIDLLRHIKTTFPTIECIMMSGYASITKAVESIKLGAFEYIEKPLSFQKIKVLIKNAISHQNLSHLMEKEIDKYSLIGESAAINKINQLIEKTAQSDFPVLITGPSGSGKEHVAHLIHLKSQRMQNDIIKLNCAAIPDTLFESELFGYEKGAFTGANTAKKGKIELAQNGTLFLDEIGELPLLQQAKLLRVLEDKQVTRLGSEQKIDVNFRLISATNRNIQNGDNEFREDLYYRIGVIVIDIPPLSERKEDIPLLATYFLKHISLENGSIEKTLDNSANLYLSKLSLKGNIRELKNLIQRLYVFSESNIIGSKDIKQLSQDSASKITPTIFNKTMPLADAKKMLEQQYIKTQLKIHNDNISHTAKSLDILPNNLSRKIKQLDV